MAKLNLSLGLLPDTAIGSRLGGGFVSEVGRDEMTACLRQGEFDSADMTTHVRTACLRSSRRQNSKHEFIWGHTTLLIQLGPLPVQLD